MPLMSTLELDWSAPEWTGALMLERTTLLVGSKIPCFAQRYWLQSEEGRMMAQWCLQLKPGCFRQW